MEDMDPEAALKKINKEANKVKSSSFGKVKVYSKSRNIQQLDKLNYSDRVQGSTPNKRN